MKVDCVGACVGVRGSRIKNVIDEINGERIDIVRWNDSMQVMIPNALQPAEIMDVQLYPRLGRAIVLVAEDQLSLAIGRRGQNVRLASKLVGWDIDIMTMDELSRDLDKAERWFNRIPGMQPEFIEALITEGFFSYTDLTFLEAEQLSEIIGIDPEAADEMIIFAEDEAERIEREGEPERRRTSRSKKPQPAGRRGRSGSCPRRPRPWPRARFRPRNRGRRQGPGGRVREPVPAGRAKAVPSRPRKPPAETEEARRPRPQAGESAPAGTNRPAR